MTLPPSLVLGAETALQLARGLVTPPEAALRAAMLPSGRDQGMAASCARSEAVPATA